MPLDLRLISTIVARGQRVLLVGMFPRPKLTDQLMIKISGVCKKGEITTRVGRTQIELFGA